MKSDGKLGVREAARILGIHENSVRNYADAGILPIASQTPVSGYRRFRAEDVAELRARMDRGWRPGGHNLPAHPRVSRTRLGLDPAEMWPGPLCVHWSPRPMMVCWHGSCWRIAADQIWYETARRRAS